MIWARPTLQRHSIPCHHNGVRARLNMTGRYIVLKLSRTNGEKHYAKQATCPKAKETVDG